MVPTHPRIRANPAAAIADDPGHLTHLSVMHVHSSVGG